jgi:DNA-binding IclR family transcriptional regulator
VQGPAARLPAERRRAILPALLDEAAALSRELGAQLQG